MSCGSEPCGRTDGPTGGCGSGRCESGACPSATDVPWLADAVGEDTNEPPVVVEVEFKGGRRATFRNEGALLLHAGDDVIVEADRGIDYGTVHLAGPMVRLRLKSQDDPEDDSLPLVVRRATPEDTERWRSNRDREIETFLVGRRTVERMNLTMKLVDVEWQFDGRKVTFYFTAEQRVDFRELVRRLARRFRTRVELRQIGARDEAARIGGIGSCGRELCCTTWLREFRPVSTQAAKTQNLPLNPVRLSGQCGRLKCCLNYELNQYLEALRRFPSVNTPIETPEGGGTIRKIDIFRERVSVQLRGGDWTDIDLARARALLGWGGEADAGRRGHRDDDSD